MDARFRFLCVLLIAIPSLAVFERVWDVLVLSRVASGLSDGGLSLLRLLVMATYLGFVIVVFEPLARALGDFLAKARYRPAASILLVLVLGLLTTHLAYPEIDSGRFGFFSDRDEALDVGARQIMRGGNPYDCRVLSGEHHDCLEQGNPIGPLPGALLLAMPFVLLFGSSAFQTPFWIALWMVRAWRRGAQAGLAVALAGGLVAPILLAELLTGGDLAANALWACLGVWLLLSRARYDWLSACLAIALGLLLAGRSNFVLVMPIVGLYLTRRWGFLRASAAAASTCAVFAALALMYYRPGDDAFGPLMVQQKLRVVGGQYGQLLLGLLSVAAAVWLGYRARFLDQALLACALTLSVPALGAVALHSLLEGRLSFEFYGWYLLSSLPFAAAALVEQRRRMLQDPDSIASLKYDPVSAGTAAQHSTSLVRPFTP